MLYKGVQPSSHQSNPWVAHKPVPHACFAFDVHPPKPRTRNSSDTVKAELPNYYTSIGLRDLFRGVPPCHSKIVLAKSNLCNEMPQTPPRSSAQHSGLSSARTTPQSFGPKATRWTSLDRLSMDTAGHAHSQVQEGGDKPQLLHETGMPAAWAPK